MGSPSIASAAAIGPTVPSSGTAIFALNVTSTDIINVPCGCCLNVSVENVSEAPPGGVAPAINVQNANLTVTKIM